MPYKNKENLYAAQKRQREKTRQKLTEYLLEHPCEICGEDDPIVLEFDHVDKDKKDKTISRIISGHPSWPKVLEKIEKCRVLCANCHRKHTYYQLGHWGKTQPS